jgi:hypothetical protein
MRVLIPVVFFALAGYFLTGAGSLDELPIPPGAGLHRGDVPLGPPREAIGDPPTIEDAGFPQQCSECHTLFESKEVPSDPLLQHQDVHLEHGMNNRCYNCHSRGDRDKLVLQDGTEIGYAEPQRLCAQCHGTTYRDWSVGAHGRTDGYWDRSRGEARRLVCTECHDPHSPAYPPYEPLPGPRTLRMGPQDSEKQHHADVANPLEKWKARYEAPADGAGHGEH